MSGRILFFVVFIILGSNVSADISPENRYIYVTPLISKNSRDIYLALSTMRKAQVYDQTILDIVAKQLIVHREFENGSEMDVQAISGLVMQLGNSHLTRYQPLIAEIAATAHQEKFVAYVQEAMNNLQGEPTEPFKSELVDLDSVKNELNAQRHASRVGHLGQPEFPVPENTPIESVYATLGYPDAISIGMGQRLLVGMDFYYYGIGIVRLEYSLMSNGGWSTSWSWPETSHELIDDSHPDAPLAHHVMTADSRQAMAVGRFLLRERISDPFIMKAVAARIAVNNPGADKYERKTLAILNKVLKKNYTDPEQP